MFVKGAPDSKRGSWARITLWMRPANERRRYIVTLSLIGWAHSQNDPWLSSCWVTADHLLCVTYQYFEIIYLPVCVIKASWLTNVGEIWVVKYDCEGVSIGILHAVSYGNGSHCYIHHLSPDYIISYRIVFYYIALYQGISARLQYLQCISNWDTAVLH